MSKEEKKIGIETQVAELYIKLRNKCVDDIIEIGMHPNLIVCKIREYGRKWQEEILKFDNYKIDPDVFIKFMKKDLLIDSCPEQLKNALKYL